MTAAELMACTLCSLGHTSVFRAGHHPAPPACIGGNDPVSQLQAIGVALPSVPLDVMQLPHEGPRPVFDPSQPSAGHLCYLAPPFRFGAELLPNYFEEPHPSLQTFPASSGASPSYVRATIPVNNTLCLHAVGISAILATASA